MAVGDMVTIFSIPSTAAGAPTAAAVADAVWDEIRSGHTAVGSFGQGVASVQGSVTGSVNAVTQPTSVGSILTDVVDADALAADAVTEIVAGLLAGVIEDQLACDGGSCNLQETLSIILAALIGDNSTLGTTIEDPTGTETRIQLTITDGKRGFITLTPATP
jgi:hypothetical protein